MFLKPVTRWGVAVLILATGCVEPSTRLLSNPSPSTLTIVDEPLAPASTQNDYAAQITAQNGTPPYLWSVVSGELPAGLNLQTEGTPSTFLTGRPQEVGTYAFVVRVIDAAGAEAEANFTLKVQGEFIPLSLLTMELAEGVVGQPYSFDLVAANGAPPYTWGLTSELDGLSITPLGNPGVMSGIPMRGGSFVVNVQVEDSRGDRVLRNFTFTVQQAQPRLEITTRVLPPARRNVAYNASVLATGGTEGSYQWRLSQGSLPLGLSLVGGTPFASIIGTPEMTGVFTFEVEVRDGMEVDGVRLELTVEADSLRIVTGSDGLIELPNGQDQQPYDAAVAAEGGLPPYTWSLSDGRLPAGVFVDSTGTPQTTVFGVPGELGTFAGTMTVTDSAGTQDTQPFELTIVPQPSPLEITTSSLPPASICNSYATEIASMGGVGPFQWRLAAGTLPSGLSLQPSTASDTAVIRGTPVRGSAGSFTVTLEVTDSLGSIDTQELTLTVTDFGDSIPVALLGDLEVDARIDLYMADLCAALPASAVRVSTNTLVDRELTTGLDDLAFSPDGSKVAFIGDMDLDGSNQVYVAEISGAAMGPPVRVSGAGWLPDRDAVSLKFSPDGRRLAFVSDGLNNNVHEIFVVDTSGAVVADSALVMNPLASHPNADVNVGMNGFQFSSNSERLIFVWDGTTDNQNEAWVADVTSLTARSAVQATTAVGGGDVRTLIVPVPGGAQFIVPGDLVTDNVTELFLVDATTLPPTTVRASGPLATNNSDVLSGLRDFGVTPDGTTLWYFADHLQDTLTNVLRVDLANPGTAVQISDSTILRNQIAHGDLLGFGPGLLVSGSLAISGRDELFVFDLNGPPNQPLAAARVNAPLSVDTDVSRNAYAASPSGAWISYAEGLPDRVMLVPMVGLQPQTAIQISPPNPSLPTPIVSRVLFGPDGRTIVFQARYDVSGQNDAYAVRLVGGVPGPWRRLTPSTPSNGDVSELVFATPNQLVIRGDIARDLDINAFAVDISNPASLPVPIASQFLNNQSDVSRVWIP